MSDPKQASGTSPSAIYDYLLSLAGTENVWRTNQEIARALGADSTEGRTAISKNIWNLRNREGGALIATRKRGGTVLDESMALAARKPLYARTPKVPRSAIVMPAPGATPVRVEPIPAPTPEAVEAVERLVRSPEPTRTLADVLRKHVEARSVARVEQIQADAVVATALETGPLSDSNGSIAGVCSADAPQARDECTADASQAQCSDAAPEAQVGERIVRTAMGAAEVADELVWIADLIERGKRPQPVVADLMTKQIVLQRLAAIVPPVTASWLLAIAQDIERVGA